LAAFVLLFAFKIDWFIIKYAKRAMPKKNHETDTNSSEYLRSGIKSQYKRIKDSPVMENMDDYSSAACLQGIWGADV
jgi:hypothetical protein